MITSKVRDVIHKEKASKEGSELRISIYLYLYLYLNSLFFETHKRHGSL